MIFKKKKPLVQIDQSPSQSVPFIIRIENTSNETQNWILFGSNKFLSIDNFGNNPSVKVSNYSTEHTTYSAILQEFSSSEMKIGLMRFQSEKTSNLTQVISHHKVNNNAGFFDVCYEQRNLSLAIMWDAYQMQSGIVDARAEILINNKTHLSGTIEAKSVILITLFPVEMVSERITNKKFSKPRISGVNVAPVIIHQVKSATKGWFFKLKNWFKKK